MRSPQKILVRSSSIGLLALFGACAPSSDAPQDPNAPAERSRIEQKLRAGLDDLDRELVKLKAAAVEAKGDAKLKLEHLSQELDARKVVAKQKLEALKSAGAGAWADVREGFVRAESELQRAVEEARNGSDTDNQEPKKP